MDTLPSHSWASPMLQGHRPQDWNHRLSQLCHLLATGGGAEFNAEFTLVKEQLEKRTHTAHQTPPAVGSLVTGTDVLDCSVYGRLGLAGWSWRRGGRRKKQTAQ